MSATTSEAAFCAAYPGGGKNFMTPHILARGIKRGAIAWELSEGESLNRERKIFGVTVVVRDGDTWLPAWRRNNGTGERLSRCFHDRTEAEAYIEGL